MKNKLIKYRPILIIILALFVPIIVKSQYNLHMIIMACIYAIMAIGLDLVMGYTGALSLAQATFYGVGAYVSALVTLKFGVTTWIGLLAAVIVTMLLSFLVGFISLRSRGTSFIIMSFSFAGIAHLVALNWVNLTNGQMGLARIPSPQIASFQFNSKISYYYLVLLFLVLTYFIATRLVNSRLGRAWIGIRENELLAESLGINPFKYSLIAFIIGSSLAGVSGSLYAHYTNFVSPENLIFSVTIMLLIMTVVGGKGTIIGPIIGSLIFTVLPEYLRIADELRMPIFGVILILLALFIPKGLVPAYREWAREHIKKVVSTNESFANRKFN